MIMMKKVNKYLPVYLIPVLLIIACSEVTEPSAAARIQINRLLDDIEDAVLNYEPEFIITLIHPDFLHNGNDKTAQSYIWHQRLLHFYTMELENREVTISQNSAIASFEMTLIGADSTSVTQEPSNEYGDVSYFIRDEGKWQLYGNQRYRQP